MTNISEQIENFLIYIIIYLYYLFVYIIYLFIINL